MDAATLKALEALPDVRVGSRAREWTAGEDAALLKHWRRARQDEVARLLGVSPGTARERYRLLIQGNE